MKTLCAFAVAAMLLPAAACSKDKKEPTTPTEPAPAWEPTEEAPAPEPEEPGTGAEDASAAELSPTIYFAHDSATLDNTERDKLDENARWLKENPDSSLVIEGHCSEEGTTEYNIALGDRRARAAQEYLVRLGVKADRLSTVSYGEERPADPSDQSKNRRGVFVAK